MMPRTLAWVAGVGLLLAGIVQTCHPAGAGEADRSPRPVALALTDGGRWLFVANQRGGDVAVVDTTTLRVAARVPVGRKLADLAATPDGTRLVVVDEEAGEVVVLRRRGSQM